MDTLTREELKALSRAQGGHRVSIFLSTHPAAPDNNQDPLTMKSLLREADDLLRARGMRPHQAAQLLHPGKDLVEDGLFWRPQPGGLAVFIAEEGMRVFRLPAEFDEQVVVGERFYVRPLLSTVDRGERFYLLALSQKNVRAFLGDRTGIVEVPLGDIPHGIEEALRNDGFSEQLQLHSGTSGAARPGGMGRRPAIFHGSGADTGITTRYLAEYCKKVSNGLREALRDPASPLVVAAVDYLIPIYREADTYHAVAPEGVVGNPDAVAPDALHAKAWPIAESVFAERRDEAVRKFRTLEGTRQATADTREVVRAAAYGQVDSLFVNVSATQWGTFDPTTGDVELHPEPSPDAEDLVDLATTSTILNGGEVWAVDVTDAPVAAVLRY